MSGFVHMNGKNTEIKGLFFPFYVDLVLLIDVSVVLYPNTYFRQI